MDYSAFCALRKQFAAEYEFQGYKLRNYMIGAVESVCDLTGETDCTKFLRELARFEVKLSKGSEAFNGLPEGSRIRIDRLRVGVPGRKLLSLLWDVSNAVNLIKFVELSLDSWQSVMQQNGLPHRYGDWVSILDQVKEIDFAPTLREQFLHRAKKSNQLNRELSGDGDASLDRALLELASETGLDVERLENMPAPDFKKLQAAVIRKRASFQSGGAVGSDDDTTRRAALLAVLDGGLLGVLNKAESCSAVDKASATMFEMLKTNNAYYDWTLDDWARHLNRAKNTINKTDAWKHILRWRLDNKKTVKTSDPSFQENSSFQENWKKKF
jgi:hypothetical protein